MDIIFNCLGYILLPFYAIYCWIKNSTKDMSENQKILFYFMLVIVGILIYDVIQAL